MHPQDAPQWAYVEQEDFIYNSSEIDSRAADDEEYEDDTTEEVLLES
jgi:hypothetical protein